MKRFIVGILITGIVLATVYFGYQHAKDFKLTDITDVPVTNESGVK